MLTLGVAALAWGALLGQIPQDSAAPESDGGADAWDGGTNPALAGAGVALDPPDAGPPSPPPLIEAGERVVPQQDFVKGELSQYLGAEQLIVKKNRIGISAGFNQIGDVYYLLVEPRVDLRLLDRQLSLGIGVPLDFEVLNFNAGPNGAPILTQNAGTFRKEDWALPSDYAKVLNYLTYGRKEDHLYINVGQIYASSIGHGAIVRRYAPDIDPNLTRVSAQVDAYNDYAGFEALTNDVVTWNLLSALGFVKPLAWLGDNLVAKTLSIGATFATDLQAPRSLMTDPSTGVRLLDSNGRLEAITGPVALGGVDLEVKVVKTPYVDIKPYVDYSKLFGGDAGLTFGVLGRFNYPSGSIVHAFRLIVEGKYLGSRYSPSYFDTFYEVDRYQAGIGPTLTPGIINYQTKYQVVMSGTTPTRGGYYVEGSYGIRNKVGVTLALEGDSADSARNAVAHVEVPVLDFFQLFASYYKRGFTNFSTTANLDEQTILFAGARLRTLPFLYINGRAYKTFTVNTTDARYENVYGFMVDLEIGYEFWTHDQEVHDRLQELQNDPSAQGNVPR